MMNPDPLLTIKRAAPNHIHASYAGITLPVRLYLANTPYLPRFSALFALSLNPSRPPIILLSSVRPQQDCK